MKTPKTPLMQRWIAKSEQMPLNDAIFLILLSLLLFASCGSIIGNVLTNFPMVANVKWIFSIGLCIVGFYLLQKRRWIEAFKGLVFFAMLFLVILPSWFYGGGDNSITLLYLLLIAVESFLMLNDRRWKIFIAGGASVSSVILLTITYKFPTWIQGNQDQNVFADTMVQIFIIFMLATVSIAIYTGRYRRQNELLRTLNARLETLAITDELSGLFNKRKIKELLVHTCMDKKLENLYVVMLDIDSFKSINDTYGHIVGDRVIRSVSDHLTSAVGNHGYAGRYGGDEFMLILFNMSSEGIETFEQRLLQVPTFDEQLHPTVSAGIVQCREHANCDALIQQADALLLQAKRNGKNNVQKERCK